MTLARKSRFYAVSLILAGLSSQAQANQTAPHASVVRMATGDRAMIDDLQPRTFPWFR